MKKSTGWMHDTLWVAWNELTGSIRSRRTLMLIIMFAGLVMLFGWHIIQMIENVVVDMLGKASDADQSSIAALWNSKEYNRLARSVLGRRMQQNINLTNMPPVGWVYGMAVFTLTPLLVILTSAPRIAEDVGNGTVRFAVIRTNRLAWCLGKYLGQAAQLPAALACAGICIWLMGWNYMSEFDGMNSAVAIFKFSLAAWIWGLGFLGIATGVSQLTAKHHLATMFGIIALVAVYFPHIQSAKAYRANKTVIWTHINKILPTGYYYDLWIWDIAHLLPAIVIIVTLSLLYVFAGYMFFARRNL